MKTAVVIGVTGQIGSYLLDLLLKKDYFVYGLARRVSNPNTDRIKKYINNPNFKLVCADITDIISLFNAFDFNQYHEYPIEVYNLAAQSHVGVSFNEPKVSMDITGLGHLNLLEVIRKHKDSENFKVFFMSSSETFGNNQDLDGFQRENTPFRPNSPYSIAKLAAFHYNRLYREAYKMDTRAAIIFNSESPRRGENFVTRKITKWFAEFVKNDFKVKDKLQLGNILAKRDWLHASDTVRAIHLMMQASPKDYVVSSGETRSISDFLSHCYNFTQSLYGCCKDLPPLEDLYEINSEFYRPCEVPYLKGDSSLIRKELGWLPEISFRELVEEMLISDIGDL